MKTQTAIARRFKLVGLLRASLVLGALYDFGFAALMVFAPEFAERVFRVPLPGETFYLWLIAVFLLMLGTLYLAAAQDPRRYSAVVVVAIGGRALGALALGAAAFDRPELAGLWPLAGGDLAFALAHAATWIPLRA
jgi:hypothetical protein